MDDTLIIHIFLVFVKRNRTVLIIIIKIRLFVGLAILRGSTERERSKVW